MILAINLLYNIDMCIVIKVNDLDWDVIFKNQIEFKKRLGNLDDDSTYLGLTLSDLDQVWLSEELQKDSLLYRTIKHELTHVYIESYGFGQFSNFTEENVADFVECYAEKIVNDSKSIFAQVIKDRTK